MRVRASPPFAAPDPGRPGRQPGIRLAPVPVPPSPVVRPCARPKRGRDSRLDVIAFLRRKLAAWDESGTAADAGTTGDPTAPPSGTDGGSKADDALVVIVGSGIEPGGGGPLPTDGERLRLLAGSYVEAVEGRCVQCGICSYNCPVGIDVRSYSRHALPVLESHCILCGECVARCPRGVLRFHATGPDA